MADLVLILDDEDGGKVDIKTCPHIMANASPFFRVITQSNFSEAVTLRNDGNFRLPLPETNFEAMKVLSNIFHLRSSHVPMENMSSDLLYEIAILVDRYDCALSIQPWPELWLRQQAIQMELQESEYMTLGEVAKWIQISSHMRYPEYFKLFTSRLIRDTSVSDCCEDPLNQYFTTLHPSVQGTANLLDD